MLSTMVFKDSPNNKELYYKIYCIMGQRTLSTCRIVTKKCALFSEIRNATDVHVRVPCALYTCSSVLFKQTMKLMYPNCN